MFNKKYIIIVLIVLSTIILGGCSESKLDKEINSYLVLMQNDVLKADEVMGKVDGKADKSGYIDPKMYSKETCDALRTDLDAIRTLPYFGIDDKDKQGELAEVMASWLHLIDISTSDNTNAERQRTFYEDYKSTFNEHLNIYKEKYQ